MLAAVGRSYNATVLKGRITETRKPDEKGEHTMRKKILKIMSVLALSMMITGGSLTAFAAEPPVHHMKRGRSLLTRSPVQKTKISIY